MSLTGNYYLKRTRSGLVLMLEHEKHSTCQNDGSLSPSYKTFEKATTYEAQRYTLVFNYSVPNPDDLTGEYYWLTTKRGEVLQLQYKIPNDSPGEFDYKFRKSNPSDIILIKELIYNG